MAIYFRPYKSIQNAPHPRDGADLILLNFLSERLGVEVSYKPDEPAVDYEDWMEPAKVLEQALISGLQTFVLPREHLRQAMRTPEIEIIGDPCPNILLGRYIESDERELQHLDFKWPDQNIYKAAHYSELQTFKNHAGRRVFLADMPGEAGPWRQKFASVPQKPSIPLYTALKNFDKSVIIKQVLPPKAWSLVKTDVTSIDTPEAADRKIYQVYGLHAARYEGQACSLLVQDNITMTYEARFFVIGHKLITGAGCIEQDTPQVNKVYAKFSDRLEVVRNSGEVIQDGVTMKRLADYACQISRLISYEAPEMPHYVVDVAIGPHGDPLVIELNPISNCGTYSSSAKHLFDAILANSI